LIKEEIKGHVAIAIWFEGIGVPLENPPVTSNFEMARFRALAIGDVLYEYPLTTRRWYPL
jgi:hypothetical protein